MKVTFGQMRTVWQSYIFSYNAKFVHNVVWENRLLSRRNPFQCSPHFHQRFRTLFPHLGLTMTL